MAYGDLKDLARRTVSDKVLSNKAFNIAEPQNMMDFKEVLLLWFISFLKKNAQVVVLVIKLDRINNWLKNYLEQLLKNSKKKNSLFFI